MKKRTLALLLSLVMVFGLAACADAPVGGAQTSAAQTSAAPETSAPATSAPETQPAAPQEVTVTHSLGDTTLMTNPQRVVVFDYGTLDALDYAGVEVVGVGRGGALAEHLSKFGDEKYVLAGSLHEPDFEKVNELKPDLILIGGRASGAYEELSKIAPTVMMTLPMAGYLDTFEANMNILAQIFPDKADVFTGKVAEIRAQAQGVTKTVEEKDYNALVIMANDSEISVFGLGSRFAMVYDDFGFKVSDEGIEQSTHGQSATFEYLVEKNPDFLFVIDRGAATGASGTTGAAQLLDNELVNSMSAAKNDRIIYLDSVNWYVVSGGITATQAMADELSAAAAK